MTYNEYTSNLFCEDNRSRLEGVEIHGRGSQKIKKQKKVIRNRYLTY